MRVTLWLGGEGYSANGAELVMMASEVGRKGRLRPRREKSLPSHCRAPSLPPPP